MRSPEEEKESLRSCSLLSLGANSVLHLYCLFWACLTVTVCGSSTTAFQSVSSTVIRPRFSRSSSSASSIPKSLSVNSEVEINALDEVEEEESVRLAADVVDGRRGARFGTVNVVTSEVVSDEMTLFSSSEISRSLTGGLMSIDFDVGTIGLIGGIGLARKFGSCGVLGVDLSAA